MVRGDAPSGRRRKVWAWIGIGVILTMGTLFGVRFVNPLFPAASEASCTVSGGLDHHRVRKGPDYATVRTDCGTFVARSEVTCSADLSRMVYLTSGVTFDFTVRGPRIPIFSEPTIMDARVSSVQTLEPEPDFDLEDEVASERLEALRASRSPEALRPFDYEQPPYDPQCDSWRTLMTTEGLQMFSIARAEEVLRVPDGEVARDPKLPCEGWKCDLE